MSTTDKASTSLPQSCPELEQFIKAQAHIRAAVRFTDDLTIVEPPQLPKEQQGFFHNLACEVTSMLFEADEHLQDLMSAFFIPLFPIEKE